MKRFLSKILLGLMLFSFIPISPASAAATSGNTPGSIINSNEIGSYSWTNAIYAGISNNYWATANIESSSLRTHYLKSKSYGISIPLTAKINGIELLVEKHQQCTFSSCTSSVTDDTVKLVKNDVVLGDNKASLSAWPTSDVVVTYGSPTDLWGTVWTPADINNANFGAVISAERTNGGTKTVFVDSMQIKVYYTENTAPSIPSIASPADLEVTSDNTPTFNWTEAVDNENDAIDYVLSIEGPITESMLVGGNSYAHAIMPDGTYVWKVKSRDEHGEFSDWSNSATFTIDTANPIISDTKITPDPFSPKDKNGVKDQSSIEYVISEKGKVTISIFDNSFEPVLVKSLLVEKDVESGNNLEVWDGKDDDGNFVPDGTYLVEISGQDLAGNKAVVENIPLNITVDNTAPIITDMDNIRTNQATFLNGSATDGGAFTGTYQWEQISGPVGGAVFFVGSNNPVSGVSADIDGVYTLRLTATDVAGNSASKEVLFTWDTKAQSVSGLYGKAGENYVDLYWVNPIDEDFAGVKIYRSSQDGQLGEEQALIKGGQSSFTDNAVLPGLTYYYTVVAIDELGNESETKTLTLSTHLIETVTTVKPIVKASQVSVEEYSVPFDSSKPKKEVKAVTKEEPSKESTTEQKEVNNIPGWGLVLLVIIALLGLYLLYQQYPSVSNWAGKTFKGKQSNSKKLK